MLAQTLQHMFVLDPSSVTWAEKVIRPVVVYIFLIVGLRLAGKRELAQINPFDFVVLMTLSNTVQNAIIGNDNSLTGGLVGAATLLVVNYLVVRLLHRHKRLERLITGHSQVLMRDGRIERDHLDREMMTKEELAAAAHKQGIGSLHDVEKCVLEPNGTLTFVAKRPGPDDVRQQALLVQLQRILDALENSPTVKTAEQK
jgi:uncharacterized membrane protein YcaP (DUF421 family)